MASFELCANSPRRGRPAGLCEGFPGTPTVPRGGLPRARDPGHPPMVTYFHRHVTCDRIKRSQAERCTSTFKVLCGLRAAPSPVEGRPHDSGTRGCRCNVQD